MFFLRIIFCGITKKSIQTMKKKDILSATETTILKLFAQGYKSPEVAKLRFNSKKTITTHRNSILAKLNVRSITAARRSSWHR